MDRMVLSGGGSVQVDAVFDVLRTLGAWALPIAFVLLAAESGLLVGVVMPGISVVVAVGVLCGAGAVPWPVGLAVVVVAAVLGPSVGFWRARWIALRDDVRSPERRRRLPRVVARVLAVAQERPLLAVGVGQWFAVARTLVPRMAGARVSWPRFLAANVPAATAWAATSFGLGVLVAAGSTVALRVISAEQASATALFVLLVAVVAACVGHTVWSRRRSTE